MRLLQSPQPSSQLRAVPSHSTCCWDAKCIGKDLGERLTLQIEIGARVAHRRRHARMPEQLTDGGELDAGFEQVNCRRVTKGMRVNASPLCRGPVVGQVLAQEIAHTEPSERPAAPVAEQ